MLLIMKDETLGAKAKELREVVGDRNVLVAMDVFESYHLLSEWLTSLMKDPLAIAGANEVFPLIQKLGAENILTNYITQITSGEPFDQRELIRTTLRAIVGTETIAQAVTELKSSGFDFNLLIQEMSQFQEDEFTTEHEEGEHVHLDDLEQLNSTITTKKRYASLQELVAELTADTSAREKRSIDELIQALEHPAQGSEGHSLKELVTEYERSAEAKIRPDLKTLLDEVAVSDSLESGIRTVAHAQAAAELRKMLTKAEPDDAVA